MESGESMRVSSAPTSLIGGLDNKDILYEDSIKIRADIDCLS